MTFLSFYLISSIAEPATFSNFKLPVSQNIHACTKFTFVYYRFIFCKIFLLHIICKQIKLSFWTVFPNSSSGIYGRGRKYEDDQSWGWVLLGIDFHWGHFEWISFLYQFLETFLFLLFLHICPDLKLLWHPTYIFWITYIGAWLNKHLFTCLAVLFKISWLFGSSGSWTIEASPSVLAYSIRTSWKGIFEPSINWRFDKSTYWTASISDPEVF